MNEVITLIWPNGRETDHDPLSLGLAPGSVPPDTLLLFNNTTRCKLARWEVGRAVYTVVEYRHHPHQGIAA